MLYRKIENIIREHLRSDSEQIMLVEGARQIGKSYIIRYVGRQMFENFVELNLVEDKQGLGLFEKVRTVEDFYLQVSVLAGGKLGTRKDTLIFLDEIQEYPHLLTLLKFLNQDRRYSYIASGSLLGVTLRQTTSIPIGSIRIQDMYPLDFEEFMIASGVGVEAISYLKDCFRNKKTPSEAIDTRVSELFKKYLITGGMPAVVQEFLATNNVVKIREMQADISRLYIADATKYDLERRLKAKAVYELIPSAMESRKKRVVAKDIEGKPQARMANYDEEFEYLISSGITLEVKAISNPKFPLISSATKNLLKLYLNDVGLLTNILFRTNIRPILDTECSMNLGAVYESVVAQELAAQGYKLFYYDNKKQGEVDYLVDDYSTLSVLPIEVKSGKDYARHTALTRFVSNQEYGVKYGLVLSNNREIVEKGAVWYVPVYMVGFVGSM